MAYVLGYLLADGNLVTNARGVSYLSLEIIDRDILEMIQAAFGSSHKITPRRRKENQNMTYRLQIANKKLCDDLRKLGFVERKDKRISVPKNMPSILLASFVRGYFDGDGNVWVGRIHTRRKTRTVTIRTTFTSSCVVFLTQLDVRLKMHGILGGRIMLERKYYRLYYGVADSCRLHDFMYCGIFGMCLERKRVIFERFLENRKCIAAVA